MTDTARRNACDDPVTYMGVLQAACTCVGILGLEGSSLSQPIRRGLRDFSSEVPGWKPVDTVELVFAIASAYGGKLPFDILAYAWQLAGRDVVPCLHCGTVHQTAFSCWSCNQKTDDCRQDLMRKA